MKKIIHIFLLLLAINFLGILFLPQLSLASTNNPTNISSNNNILFKPQITIPDPNGGTTKFKKGSDVEITKSTKTICEYILVIYKYAIGVIAIFAAVMMIIGGVIWITSSGSPGRISVAKDWIVGSLLGILIALASFLLLATINPELTICKHIAIEPLEKKLDVLFYTPSPYDGDFVKLDNSNNYWCCVIDGDLDGSGKLLDTEIKACGTYESENKNTVNQQCKIWYKNYTMTGIDWGWGIITTLGRIWNIANSQAQNVSQLHLENSDIPYQNIPTGPGKNTATVYNGKCSSINEIKNWCISKDTKKYCANKKDGADCLIKHGDSNPSWEFGYCNGNNCMPCKRQGDRCSNHYECTNQTTTSALSCGLREVHTGTQSSSICFLGKCCPLDDKTCPTLTY